MPDKMQPQQNHIESHEINPVTQVLHKMDKHVYYEMELHKGIISIITRLNMYIHCINDE